STGPTRSDAAPLGGPPRRVTTRRTSPLLVGEELARVDDLDAVALGVLDAADVDVEVDGAHDPVAEHLVDDGLDARPVHLGDLVEPVDEGVDGDAGVERAFGGDLLESLGHLGPEVE